MEYYRDFGPLIIALVTFGGLVWTNTAILKNSLRSVNSDMTDMKNDLKQLTQVMITQVAQSGRIDRIEDRVMAQGKRLDEGLTRLNDWVDAKAMGD